MHFIIFVANIFTNIYYLLVPPFGQDEEKVVQSIFDIPHLHSSAIMLNIQCKLPVYI